MPKSIPGRAVLQQLKADLTGKDSYRGVTLTYAWMANQFGHFSLGFIPTIVLFTWLVKSHAAIDAVIWAFSIVALNWLIFEVFNFCLPLLFKRRSALKFFYYPKQQYVFRPPWRNVLYDTATDIGFFWLGVFCAAITCYYSAVFLAVVIALVVLLIKPTRDWFITKMYLQVAEYPFQFRLSQWDIAPLSARNMANINQFLRNNSRGMHLLVFGSEGSGKTSLSVGVATELSIKHKTCSYTTGIKLYSAFCDEQCTIPPGRQPLWTWANASVLVIDDINSGGKVEDLIQPDIFWGFINRHATAKQIIKNANVVWVLGNYPPGHPVIDKWKTMLRNMEIEPADIYEVNL
ncbi:MAG TPA: hypothetical protein VHB48_14060 [Chitinophagaceae bacterium]|nr:hypothetical protein [Chitinophagaceae bacterium]